jgi:predicted transposase YbfD/YdcC
MIRVATEASCTGLVTSSRLPFAAFWPGPKAGKGSARMPDSADWLSERLDLEHGVPASDTFRRVISRLDPEAFARGFMRWIRGGIAEKIEGEVALAIDGKTVRRSYEKGDPKAALHMLSAWASEQRLVLAQQKVDGKTNEIGALPDLLEVLDLQGCTVTIDAMETQRHIAAEITEQGGDYALALKGNQKKLYREVREYFEEEGFERGFEGMPVTCADTTDIGHGRKEERRLWVSSE